MSWMYQTKDLLASRGLDPEHLVAGASQTVFTLPTPISHLDSIHGIWVRLVGVRGGGDVEVQLQESMVSGSDARWTDVGPVFLFGAGGVFGGANVAADVENFLLPPANTTFKPNLRLKITTAAATEFRMDRIIWSVRGLR